MGLTLLKKWGICLAEDDGAITFTIEIKRLTLDQITYTGKQKNLSLRDTALWIGPKLL